MEKFGISGQIIEGIYHSNSSDNWILLKTDQSTFELRLGGINPTNEIRSEKYLMILAIGNKPIKTIKTDDFTIYIELASGECVVHSQSFISGDVESNLMFDSYRKKNLKVTDVNGMMKIWKYGKFYNSYISDKNRIIRQ